MAHIKVFGHYRVLDICANSDLAANRVVPQLFSLLFIVFVANVHL